VRKDLTSASKNFKKKNLYLVSIKLELKKLFQDQSLRKHEITATAEVTELAQAAIRQHE